MGIFSREEFDTLAVHIRLRRVGKTKAPSYRVVVADSRAPRNGKFIESIGHYDPLREPVELVIDLEHVAKQLVEDPSAVVVTEELDGDFIKLHLQVGEADVGKVIGRGGRIAKAIRALLKVMATRDGTKVNLEID